MLFVNFSARRWHKMTTGRIRSIIIYIVCLEKNQSSFERILAKFQSISPTAVVILKRRCCYVTWDENSYESQNLPSEKRPQTIFQIIKACSRFTWMFEMQVCGPTFFNPCFIKEFVWTDVRNLYTFLRCLFHFAYSSFSK